MTSQANLHAIVHALTRAAEVETATTRYTAVAYDKMTELGIVGEVQRFEIIRWLFDEGIVKGSYPSDQIGGVPEPSEWIQSIRPDAWKWSPAQAASGGTVINAFGSTVINESVVASSFNTVSDGDLGPIFQQLIDDLEAAAVDLTEADLDDARNDIEQLDREIARPKADRRWGRITALRDSLVATVPSLITSLAKLIEALKS